MATKYGSWGWHNAQTGAGWRSVLVYTVSETDTTYTINTTLRLQQVIEGYADVKVTAKTTIGNSTSTKTLPVASYAGNTTTTLMTKSRTYTKGSSTQSVTVSGQVDNSWGEQSTVSQSFTIPRRSYAVTYNANGGDSDSVPASQVKYQGVSLTLSSTVPTRAGYTFLGWNTGTKANGVHYDPGAPYTGNASLKLYAMWLSVSVPTMEVLRTDDAGTETDEGTYGTLAASWQSGGTVPAMVTVTASNPTVGSITLNGDTSGSYAAGGSASGNVDALFGGSFSLDTRYRVVVSAVVTTPYNVGTTLTATAVAYVEYAYITIDVRKGGHGVTFGGPAVEDGLHSYMPATFHDTLTAPNIGAITTADGTVSVASGTGTAICSVTLDPGTYIIEGNLAYLTNATGRRIATLSVTAGNATSASILSQTGVEVPATGGGYTALHTTWMTKRTSPGNVVYLNAYQDSGSSLSVTGYIRAMRIA